MPGIWSHFFWDVDEETIKERRTLCDIARRIGTYTRLLVAYGDQQKSP